VSASPTVTPPADVTERQKAIWATGHAFVWASAGTGKTHTLTLRALYLLLHAPFLTPETERFTAIRGLYDADDRMRRLRAARETVRSLVLTTFTRKAAAEMQTRLYAYLDLLASTPTLERLLDLTGSDPLFMQIWLEVIVKLDSDESHEGYARLRLGAEALAEMACEFQIATIHSLAASMLERHPIESGVPAGARFAEEDDDVGDLDQPLARRWWLSVGLVSRDLRADLEKCLEKISPFQARDWFKKVYHHPELIEQIEALRLPDAQTISRFQEACAALGERLSRRNGRRISANAETLRDLASRWRSGDMTAWEEACAFFHQNRHCLFLDDPKTPDLVKAAIQELAPESAAFFETCLTAQTLCARMYTLETCAEQWAAWKRVLAGFLDWARQNAVAATGVVGFDEMIRLAADLLERHPGVRRAERRRLRALLVDEFQDTDPEQLRLISALLRPDADSDHEITAFFVGDTKQSIYRFRGADVNSTVTFHDQYTALVGHDPAAEDLTLSTSFRSLPPITRLVNRLFSESLGLTTRPEEELRPSRTDEGETPEWVWIARDAHGAPFTAAAGRRLAAEETVRIIEDLRGRRQARWSDILVLVRSGRELDAALSALEDAGIPAVSSGARTLYRQPEVSDVLNLLIALLNPLDTLAVGAVLRSPLAALSDPDIYRLIGAVKPSRLIHSADPLPGFLPAATHDRLTALRKLAATRGGRALSDWALELQRLIPLVAYTDPLDLEGRSHARINQLFEAFLEEIQRGSTPALAWLLKQRARAAEFGRYDADLGEDVSVADDSIDAVRVMTVHKAKGLQARYTIVYCWASILHDIASPAVKRRPPLVTRFRSGVDMDLAFLLPFGSALVSSDNLGEALAAEEQACRAEAVRLAYVACTRAQDGLSLVCATPRSQCLPEAFEDLREMAEGLGKDSPHAEALDGLARLRPAGEAAPGKLKAPASALQVDLDRYAELWLARRRESEALAALPIAHPSASGLEEGLSLPAGAPGAGQPATVLRLAGTLVHAYLERWLLDRAFEPDKLARLARRFEAAPQARARADVSLSLFYAGALPGGPLFSYHARARSGKVLGRETPFYMSFEEIYWNGVIDLILEERGVIRGVDYKTSAEKEELPDSYARQAKVYTEALRRIFPGRQVEFEFWWLAPEVGETKKARRS
jgi:ATP-dependent exoDNAse (exonuclease V) beta subunit